MSAFSALLVHRLGSELRDSTAGLVAGILFATASVSRHVLGSSANTEALLLPFALAGVALYLEARRRNTSWLFLASGLMVGMALAVKHQAVFFGAALLVDHALRLPSGGFGARNSHLVRGALLALGGIAPLAIQTAIYAGLGLLGPYTYWLFEHPRVYASGVALGDGVALLRHQLAAMTHSMSLLFALAAFGLTSPLWDERVRRHGGFLAVFVAMSALAVVPTFLFIPHYWILLLPALALSAGLGVAGLAARLPARGALARRALVGAALLAAAGTLIAREADYLFRRTPDQVSRAIYGMNPFPESKPIARYLAAQTRPGERVAILGSEPQILFEAERVSAIPYLYAYPLMKPIPEASRMQREVMRTIERQRPR
jgi:4-amino-4-deoxy-L-arabinose transferase-like glycosyltransferase